MEPRGAYPADRAAALSGVPKSTVHYWAREDVLVPSISADRVKLWSYPDLLGLRTIYWLRQEKVSDDGRVVRKTPMRDVRRALKGLRDLDYGMWGEAAPRVAVDRAGHVVFVKGGGVQDAHGQGMLDADMLDLVGPFVADEGLVGPDLHAPRPHLRIVPGKLGGAPHVERTRVETEALGALAQRGFPSATIYRLYPRVERIGVDEALDLERQLSSNLKVAA